jgi:tetratricopeptide (TPR) repeat protein
MPVITAIELLLDCGDLKAADDLYGSRLENGDVLKWIPAPHWGMEVARWFVPDAVRRQRLEAQKGSRPPKFYLISAGLFASLAGEPETALPYFDTAEALYRQGDNRSHLSIALRDLAWVETPLGRLGDAVRHATEALENAVRAGDDDGASTSHADLAFAASLRGDIDTAGKAFAEAIAIQNRIDPSCDCDLYSIWGVHWAEHLLRTGQASRARKLTDRNRKICEEYSWQEHIAQCKWMLGWLDAAENDWRSAHGRLDQAEATFTRGHMIEHLANAHLTRSACHLGEGHLDRALAAYERALDLAAPRNYRLIHSDGLVLRARIALARGDAAAARNDAESALQIANDCEYAWAERDACEILTQAWGSFGNRAEATRYADRAANLNRRLTPTE